MRKLSVTTGRSNFCLVKEFSGFTLRSDKVLDFEYEKHDQFYHLEANSNRVFLCQFCHLAPDEKNVLPDEAEKTCPKKRLRVTSSLESPSMDSKFGRINQVHTDSLNGSVSKEYSDRSAKRKVRESISSVKNPRLKQFSPAHSISSTPLQQFFIPIIFAISLVCLYNIIHYCCHSDSMANVIAISLSLLIIACFNIWK